MALIEQDREDLFRDGRAMIICGEAIVDGEPWVVGFRADGALSLYFGPDAVFQFDRQLLLRRVFIDEDRFAASEGKLLRIKRLNRGHRLALQREPLEPEELVRVTAKLHQFVLRLQSLISHPAAQWRVRGSDLDAWRSRVSEACDRLVTSAKIADVPNA